MSKLSNELLNKFIQVAGDLSPENLTCDGELSPAQVSRKHKELMSEWRELEREAGRKVTEDEVWRQYDSAQRGQSFPRF